MNDMADETDTIEDTATQPETDTQSEEQPIVTQPEYTPIRISELQLVQTFKEGDKILLARPRTFTADPLDINAAYTTVTQAFSDLTA